jgi:streptogramin lyase
LSTFHEYPLPDLPRFGGTVAIHGITAGPDGNVWFTDTNANAVGSITPSGSITEFAEAGLFMPRGIATGADGNLWVASRTGHAPTAVVTRITPDGTSTNFPVPVFLEGTFGIPSTLSVTLGPDGNIWYSEAGYSVISSIGNVTPDGQATGYPIPGSRNFVVDEGMTAGPDGNVWFVADVVTGNNPVGRITPDGQYTLFPTPHDEHAISSITAGPDGNLWAGAFQQDRPGHQAGAFAAIDRITVDGQFTVFRLPQHPDTGFAPSITVGPDGNIWFTESALNRIGSMTLDGQITEYDVPTPNSQPELITAGPDGNIWFTEPGSGQIGEFVLNDAGGLARSAPKAKGTLAVNAAAVETLFAGASPQVVDGVVSSQLPTGADVDAAFAARPTEAATVPTGSQVRTAAGVLPHLHKGDQPATVDVVGLADPLTETL